MLVCGLAGRWVGVQPEAPEGVVQQSLPYGDAGLAPSHAVVECHHLLLRVGQAWMRADFERDVRVPVSVLVCIDVAGAGAADAEDARQQEVVEAAVDEHWAA